MLEPNSRRLLLDSLQPPPTFQLDIAVGTTYTLDLMALLAAPVAFAFTNWQDRDGRPLLEPLALLKAIRQNADRMLLFCQAGRIQVPSNYQNLMIDLEDSIVEANAIQSSGAFHPKVWFLKFVGRDGEVMYRMLCLSRNMTFDRSWDTSVCLEGPLTDRANAISRNHPLGQFVEALPSLATRSLSKSWNERLKTLAYEIRRVDFEVPEGFDEVLFHPIGIGKKANWPFPDKCDNLLVMSPFVSDGALSDLAATAKKSQLISRVDQLDLLASASIEAFGNGAWTLDEQAQPEPAELESDQSEIATTVGRSERVSAPLSGLHAKVYVLDQGWNTSLFTGSANATHAAFNMNVEFLTELVGRRSVCGVDVILGKPNADQEIRNATSLADMLVQRHSLELGLVN